MAYTGISTLPNVDTAYLDQLLLDSNQRLRLFPAEVYEGINYDHLRIWCIRNARYGLPTQELVDWLKANFDLRSAVEIGAGMGDLGYHLGVRMTDSAIQQNPMYLPFFQSMKQEPTNPPEDVERIDALAAVFKYQPQLVIGSWITQRKPITQNDGFFEGVDELSMFRDIPTFIHIGNENVHASKSLRKYPHKTYHFPWVYSRAQNHEKNVIYVWT